ncbi:dicarboxylate/amino acid:cation symporter [Desulfovibrio sp. OttesenSCG-928-F20]|nr:dicarboxylate/amino acid:cation symporter [Desulfovibrio sp. OttesenSCG-928-M16]MDL2291156.1 dicarboxylate/amino acid:cation symporter [Desulfovibrio sp. OttesenSCG-928-F20]
MSLPAQMAIGLVLGVVVGLAAPAMGIDAGWFKPLGDLFIRLIRMVVVPLVLFTLIAGAASSENVRKLGRVATKTLVYYFATTAVAVTLGLVLASFLHPGLGLDLSTANLTAKQVQPPSLLETILNIVPMNPMESLVKGSMLQIIVFAILFGFSISAIGPKARPLYDFFEMCGNVMIKLTSLVMLYAPIGVFGLMAFTVARHGLDVLLPLAKVIGVVYLGAVIHVTCVYMPIIRYTGLKLSHFFKIMTEPLLVAFTTCSSAAALPSNMRSVRKLGASKAVSSFSIPFGNTINMDGTAIYMGVVAIFVAEVYGIPLDFSQKMTVMLMGLLASIGTMGVPGAALIMVSIIFIEIGVPLEGIALVAGIDRILDMARTTLNVLGDATAAVLVTKTEGELGADEYIEGDDANVI